MRPKPDQQRAVLQAKATAGQQDQVLLCAVDETVVDPLAQAALPAPSTLRGIARGIDTIVVREADRPL